MMKGSATPVVAPSVFLASILFGLMVVFALMAQALQPGQQQRRSSSESGFVLEQDIPKHFGHWQLVPSVSSVVVNPEVQEFLDRVYSQILTRTYINDQGYRIMLSMAYGEDQRGGLQAHRPEVCYPAQGFELISNEPVTLKTVMGDVEGRRLMTRLGGRAEPLTYWFNVGSKPVTGRIERRMEEIRLVMTGGAPDGLLFRVSSIDPDMQRGFEEQQRFVSELLSALPAATRRKISGL